MNDTETTTRATANKQDFQVFRELVAKGESSHALENLANRMLEQKHFHELFEIRKIQLRNSMNLPVRSTESTTDLPSEIKAAYEQGLVEACREVGTLLVNDNRLREAWVYLQAIDDQNSVRDLLMSVEIDDENADDLIGLAVNEGIAPVEGFDWILDRMGTCNAITTYDSFFIMFTPEIRQVAAEKLILHLHQELKTNLINHVKQQRPDADFDASIAEIIEQQPWVFGEGMRHIDESHLASVVRIGRIAMEPNAIAAAADLAAYGQTMPSDYSATGDIPFEDLYADSEMFYQALANQHVEKAKAFFREKANACQIDEETSAAIEWYLFLLSQIGENRLAIEESLRLLPNGASMNIAPSLFELCESQEDWAKIQDYFESEGRLLEFSVAMLENSTDLQD